VSVQRQFQGGLRTRECPNHSRIITIASTPPPANPRGLHSIRYIHHMRSAAKRHQDHHSQGLPPPWLARQKNLKKARRRRTNFSRFKHHGSVFAHNISSIIDVAPFFLIPWTFKDEGRANFSKRTPYADFEGATASRRVFYTRSLNMYYFYLLHHHPLTPSQPLWKIEIRYELYTAGNSLYKDCLYEKWVVSRWSQGTCSVTGSSRHFWAQF
jgi:hypothetical protein